MTPDAGYGNLEAIVWEHNILYDDRVKMTYDEALFNQYSSRAAKSRGIYSNEYNGKWDVVPGVNAANNCVLKERCAEGLSKAIWGCYSVGL